MKFRLAFATVMLSLASSSFAATSQENIKCPDINELKASQFSEATSVYDTNLWEVIQPANQYGTKNSWNFKVNIEADDKIGALKQAVVALGDMKLMSGPEKVDNAWMCHYRSGQHDAVAVLNTTQPTVAAGKAKKLAAK